MKKSSKRLIILISVLIIITVILTIVFWPFIRNLRDEAYRENISAWVKSLGFKGPLLLFCIQILQIFVAVIPGGPIQIMAGMAYGALGGFAVIITGIIFASALVFFLGRKFGLPLLRRFLGEDDLITWSFLKDSRKTARLLFFLFLIPGTPKDILTWLAPLSNISLPSFIILASLARIPAILTSTITGDSMMEGNWILSISLFFIIAVLGLLGMWFRERIISGNKHPE